jgi:dihydroxyacid dehydratase/phosphogluconate dehydratase
MRYLAFLEAAIFLPPEIPQRKACPGGETGPARFQKGELNRKKEIRRMTRNRGLLRSSIVTAGLDRATHRSLFYSMGWHPEHLQKPLVGVVNSFNELMPGHFHLTPLCQAIKLGIAEAGGAPLEFPSIAVCDGIATGHAG